MQFCLILFTPQTIENRNLLKLAYGVYNIGIVNIHDAF